MKGLYRSVLTVMLAAICIHFSCSSWVKTVHIEVPEEMPQAAFAAEQIEKALVQAGYQLAADAALKIQFQMSDDLEAQAYQISADEDQIIISGGDARGVMYGGLELAEQIGLTGKLKIKSAEGKAYLENRGIKFNIPLDARTPSYDDTGDAAQNNYAEMWSMDFWTEFLDNMAIHRYNTLTLWNPHPFPTMIKLKEYPDVSLDDVYVTTIGLEAGEGKFCDPQLVSSLVMNNIKRVKKISIDEKIKFWQDVMRYARHRGIDIYFITWNICPNSVATPFEPYHKTWGVEFIREKPGKYGITHEISNPKTITYYQKAVKQFILTYPDLKGIGVTAGEHMPPNSGQSSREKWLWEAYGKGILAAKKVQPDREIHFIHRVWYSDLDQIMEYWGQYPDPFDLSFKYAKAHMYSSPHIVFDDAQIEKMKPHGLKCWWNMRNDDIFVHRWGDPDYARHFLQNFDYDYTAGYHMGSDGYVWGRESVTKDGPTMGQLEIVKHWYRYMMWGRLGYNPDLDHAFFISKLKEHFPKTDVKALYAAWQAASQIIPQVNRLHWRNWDYMGAPEGCIDSGGFRTIEDFVDNPSMEGQGILNPKDYVDAKQAGKAITEITPLQVADNLDQFAGDALKYADQVKGTEANRELELTCSDIRGMAWLGRYYAEKFRAAVEVAAFQNTGIEAHRAKAVQHLETAVGYWETYAQISHANYKVQMLARVEKLDWNGLLEDVKKDVDWVRSLK